MSDRDNEPSEISVAPADLPEEDGGTADAFGDTTVSRQPAPADVPEGSGGTGG